MSIGNVMGMGVVGGVMPKEMKNSRIGKVMSSAVTAGGIGYAAASMQFNPTGKFATKAISMVNKAKDIAKNVSAKITKTDAFSKGKNFVTGLAEKVDAKGMINKAKNFTKNLSEKMSSSNIVSKAKTYVKDLAKKITSSNAYKKAGEYANKGINYLKNTGVGKWAAKNPAIAIALGAAAIAGTIAAVRTGRKDG